MNIALRSMELAVTTATARRTPVVLAALVVVAVAGFALVSRLVTRYHANEKQLAWHVFEQGMRYYKAGDPVRALDDFRTALTYDPDNFQYQLNLARALRDSNNLPEAATYLETLWQRNPEDGVVNQALARLAVRRGSVPDALRYYHNAIYGAWDTDPETNRRNARLELINFLIQRKAYPLAESELIGLVQTLPHNAASYLEAASLYGKINDYDQALTTYRRVLQFDPGNPLALAGAGNAAFQLGRYRTAEQFFEKAVDANRNDEQSRQSLQIAKAVLSADPFRRRISDAERNRRLIAAFSRAGQRLQDCAQSRGVDLKNPTLPPDPLQSLQAEWDKLHPQLKELRSAGEADLPDSIMDLVAQIETQTAQQCGSPTGFDLALLLISRDRDTVDQ
jgi:tetratricopeptide (TPR) repeat protein